MERYEVKSSDLHLAFDPEQPGLMTVYLASEVDARIAELEAAYKASAVLSGEVIEDRNRRVAELEKALREIIRTAATVPGSGCGGVLHPYAAQYLVSARTVEAARALMGT